MKTFKLVTLITIMTLPIVMTAQIKHELSFNRTAWLKRNYSPSYEVIFNKRIGIDLTTKFKFSRIFLSDSSNPNLRPITGNRYFQTNFLPSINVKYYLFPEQHGYGIFFGPYFRVNHLLYLDKGYAQKWEETRNTELNRNRVPGIKSIFYGFSAGYKYLFKSHLTFEISGAIVSQKEILLKGDYPYDQLFLYNLYSKLGYRF